MEHLLIAKQAAIDFWGGQDRENMTLVDIGVGYNCVYPLLACKEFGWKCIGTEISEQAIAHARELVSENDLEDMIEIHLQTDSSKIFADLPQLVECKTQRTKFDLLVCNPPFYE